MLLNKKFFSLKKFKLENEILNPKEDLKIINVPLSKEIFLSVPFSGFDEEKLDFENLAIKTGDKVKKGQKIPFSKDSDDFLISNVSGIVKDISISDFMGDSKFYKILIQRDEEEICDETFGEAIEKSDVDTLLNYLQDLPGADSLSLINKFDNHFVIVKATDKDPFTFNNQYFLMKKNKDVFQGIKVLQNNLNCCGKLKIAIFSEQKEYLKDNENLEKIIISKKYPSAFPNLINNVHIHDKKSIFLSTEFLTNLTESYNKKELLFDKVVMVVDKDQNKHFIKVRVGTKIKHILDYLKIDVKDKDQVVLNGIFTGFSVPLLDYVVFKNTNSIHVIDSDNISHPSDSQCVNCGECVSVCPVKIPINIMVRFLDAGQYEECERYGIHSCLQCGLCSFLCPAKIPIAQYIALGKEKLQQQIIS